MLTEKQLNRINELLEKKIFKYKGEIIPNIEITIDFDYKVKLLGYKKMISFGEWTDYLKVSINIVKFNDNQSRIFLKNITPNPQQFYYLKMNLIKDISDIMYMFEGTDVNVKIEEIEITDNIKENFINEGKMSKIAIRTVVKDIVNKVKNKKSGFFHLPSEESEYEFTNLPFSFSVELTLKLTPDTDKFKVNGYYVPDEELIELIILFNPDTIKTQFYDLIGELNELIAHELEHAEQDFRGELNVNPKKIKNSLSYYTQDNEISAQYKGFKRLSKLTKKPFERVTKEWFQKNKDIHGMDDKNVKIVIDKILDYNKKLN